MRALPDEGNNILPHPSPSWLPQALAGLSPVRCERELEHAPTIHVNVRQLFRLGSEGAGQAAAVPTACSKIKGHKPG